ncbi:polysaccharide deacetylase family protein [Natronococcus roseus]|uniref:polysaccharide deacetylase family protein n=1 Tax=Natronococcus roseus TaxID=1052014 RepID=UPI00374DB483
MRRRNLLAVVGVTAAGGAATAYGVSQRDSDENGGTGDDENESDGNGDDESGSEGSSDESADEEADDEQADDLEERLEGSEGMLVFTYDDSPIEDYTLTYQVHQEYDVPGCVAACPGWMEDGGGDEYLSPDQLREMHDDGWGVMSHTYYHRALGKIQLTETALEGDDRIYVEANRHADIEEDPLVIFDDENRTTATVAGGGSDSTGEYVELAEPLEETIDASGHVRYPEEFMQNILDETDAQLEEWGLTVLGFVYTYTRYHGLIEDLVRDHYEAVANHRFGGGHNEIDGLDPTTMQRMYIETDRATEEEIEEFMQTAAEDDVLSIVGGHSQFETITEERLRYTIETALEHDLAIVTMEEALDELELR